MRRDNGEMRRQGGLLAMLGQQPHARACIRGSEEYADLTGCVRFYQTRWGVLVSAEVWGLPTSDEKCGSSVFAFHIHRGESCTGNESDPFADALTHYDPGDCPHPHHAGDLPPLFGNNGYAFQTVLTDRFRVGEIIGKTVIIHAGVDDFTSQPAGNAGKKIACGEIRPICPCRM